MKNGVKLLLAFFLIINCNTPNKSKINESLKIIDYIENDIPLFPQSSIEDNTLIRIKKIKSITVEVYSILRTFPPSFSSVYINNYIINDSLSINNIIYFLDSKTEFTFNKSGLITSSNNYISNYYEGRTDFSFDATYTYLSPFVSYYSSEKKEFEYIYNSNNTLYKIIRTEKIKPKEKIGFQLHGMILSYSIDTISYTFSQDYNTVNIIKKGEEENKKKYEIKNSKIDSKIRKLDLYLEKGVSNNLIFSKTIKGNQVIKETDLRLYHDYNVTYDEVEYLYNNSNILIKKIYINKPKNRIDTILYEYTDDKNYKNVKTYEKGGWNENKHVSYDSNGNWILKKDINSNLNIIVRKIEYHQ